MTTQEFAEELDKYLGSNLPEIAQTCVKSNDMESMRASLKLLLFQLDNFSVKAKKWREHYTQTLAIIKRSKPIQKAA